MWEERSILELAADEPHAVNGGPFGSKLGRKDYVDDGVPVIRGANLPSDRRFSYEGLVFVSEAKAAELRANLARPRDVVVTQRGTIGQVGMIPVDSPYPEYVTSQSQMKVTVNQALADSDFVYYSLRSPASVRRLQDLAISAGVPHVNLEMFRDFKIQVPSLPVQRKIATVLAAYDELIENNLRRIEILEKMGQAVYREWFVNFRFPGHEEVAFVDSPLGPIPEGWEARKFGTIADEIKDGVDPSTVDADVRYVGLEHIPQESFTLMEWGSAADVASRKWRFTSGDVLFGKLRPYFHKVVEAGFEGICSTDAIVIRPVNGFGDLALQVAFSKEFVAHAVATSGGTDRPRAKWADLANFHVVVPDAATRAVFSRSVRPMVDLAANLARQNANLRATRDLLLPKLVSGEIDVSRMEIDTEWLAS